MRAAFRNVLVTLSALLMVTAAHAKPMDDEACMTASTSGQTLRKQTKLVDARVQFETCAAQTCPDVVRQDCLKWSSELASLTPTVALSAVDGAGRDLIDVAVTVDGKPLVSKLEGKAITLDPGIHTFVFSAEGASPVEERAVVNEGEKGKRVLARFLTLGVPKPAEVTAPPLATPAPSKGVSVGALVVGGVGLAALATGTILFLSGTSSFPEDKCDPLPLFSVATGTCPRTNPGVERETANSDAKSANTSRDVGAGLMIGGGALTAAGLVWLIIDLSSSKREKSATWRPTVGWNTAGIQGTF